MISFRLKRNRLHLAPLAALAICAFCAFVSGPDGASAATKFRVEGRGFGHGVGMSQWGAFGFAREGASRKKILGHYYKGTSIGRAGSKDRDVRVLVGVRSGAVSFSNARKACGAKLDPKKSYRANLDGKGRNVRLERADGGKIKGCGKTLTASGKRKIRIDGEGTYRGDLAAVASSGGLNVVNVAPIDGYVRGVVPNEMPASWPAAALQAQAVAARSYALSTRVDGEGFDLYDDTRSQVYEGVASEQASTNDAVKKTSEQVVVRKGKVITAFYFSTSGGRTENVEFGFPGGSPQPYLKSVRDPFDDASPHHKWSLTFSRGELESKLGGMLKGSLREIKVTKTGRSPRIVEAKVIGSGGSTTVSGDDLRFQLGLMSTWARFKKR